MSAQLVALLQEIAGNQQQASRPVNILLGTVLSEEPNISIKIDQKRVLTKEFLILTRNVTDHNVDMTVDHWTEDADPQMTAKKSVGGKEPSVNAHAHKHSHKHPYKGRKTFLVHKKLLAGEMVVLASVQGGQKYVILDRIWSNLNDTNAG